MRNSLMFLAIGVAAVVIALRTARRTQEAPAEESLFEGREST